MKKKWVIVVCLLIALTIIGTIAISAYKSSESYRKQQAAVTTVMDGITVKVTEVIDCGSCNVVVNGGNSVFSPEDTLTVHYNGVRENGSEYSGPLKCGDMLAVTYERYSTEHSDNGYSITVEYVDLVEIK